MASSPTALSAWRTAMPVLAVALAFAVCCGSARAETPELVEGPAAVAYLNAQRQANGIPPFTKEESSLASWCPNEKGGAGGSGNRALSADPFWDAASSPWSPTPSAPAPFHEALIYDPEYTTVGDVNAIGPYNGEAPELEAACVSTEGEGLAPTTPEGFIFYSPVGASGLPPKVTAFEDYTPAQAHGLPATTGPNLIVYAVPTLGHLRLPYAPHAVAHATLETAGGEQVPNVETVAADDSFILVPPPLAPSTDYVGEVLVSINATESVPDRLRFSTGPEETIAPPTNIERHTETVVQPPLIESPPVFPAPRNQPVAASVKILSVHLTRDGATLRIRLGTAAVTSIKGFGFRSIVKTLDAGEHRLTLAFTKTAKASREHHKPSVLSVTVNVIGKQVTARDRVRL